MRFVGIDPGKDGGIVSIDETGKILEKIKIPLIKGKGTKSEYDIPAVVDIVRTTPVPSLFILEKSQPMPMSGISAQFHRGFSSGLWQGVLVSLGLPYEIIHPRTWQKVFFRDVNTEDTKQASIIVAKRLWPKEDWRKSERARNPDVGFTDAALLAEFGRRLRMTPLQAQGASL